jgi:hypothetical protein
MRNTSIPFAIGVRAGGGWEGCSPPDWIEWTIFGKYISLFRAIYFNKCNITYFMQKQLFLDDFFVEKLAKGGGEEVQKFVGKNYRAG